MRISIFFTICLFSSFLGWSQSKEKVIIEYLKKQQFENPVNIIIVCDSLLQESVAENRLFAAKVKYYKANGLNTNANHKRAIDLADEIIGVFEKNKEYPFLVNTLLLKSNANNYLNNDTEAINNALEALQISKDNQLDNKIALIYSEMAFNHYGSGDFLKAIEYMLQAEAQQIKIKDNHGLSSTYNNIAVLYKNIHDLDNALKYNLKSLDLNISLGIIEGIPKSYNNIGLIYSIQNDITNAKKYFEKAVAANIEYGFDNISPLTNYGDMYMKINDYDLAEIYYNKALTAALKSENDYKLRSVYEMLLKVNLQQKDFENSYKFQTKIDSLSLIISKIESDEKIKMLESKHETFQKEQELIAAKESVKLFIVIFIVILFLFILTALYVIQKQKINKLNIEKDKVILEQQILRSQMNPHFIFNALSAIQNTVMDNDPIKSASYLSRFAKLIRQNFEFTSKHLITLQEDLDALENYIETQKLRLQYPLVYKFDIDAAINPNTIEIPPMLLQPFIENAIEHGLKEKKEDALITISIMKNGAEKVKITIIDNGKGYFPKSDKKLHSTEITLKRLELFGKGDEKSFSTTNLGANAGTKVQFNIHVTA